MAADDDLVLGNISVDSDWKRQAQEEKRRLEEEARNKAAAPPPSVGGEIGGGNLGPGPSDVEGMPAGRRAGRGGARAGGAGRGRSSRAGRELPEPSFATLVQTLASQALLYLGGMALSNGETMVDLDTAKHQLDLMAVLEEKSKGNLTPEEQEALDVALYETRMRYVGVAQRYIL